jgi:hypothetical protein
MIMKTTATDALSHPYGNWVIGFTNTDQAYTVPSIVIMITPDIAMSHLFDIKFSLLIFTPPVKNFSYAIIY